MKILFYQALFLLGFITIAHAQTNNNYPQWQHPILKELRAGSKTLTPFYNKDSTAFVTVSVIDNKQKNIYWFDCYGYYFDAVSIPESNIQAIVKKNITAFKYYDLITTDYLKVIIKARNNFQSNGNTAKFTPYEKQLLQIDDSIKFPSTLKKLIELDKQKMSVERQIREFHSINPLKIKEDTVFSKTHDIQYGSMLTTYNGQDTLTTYYNRIAFAPVYKAVLTNTTATIKYYNRGNQLIDEIKFNNDRLDLLRKQKTDVFLLYRGWLEMKRYNIIETIANINIESKKLNKSEVTNDHPQLIFTSNSIQSLLYYSSKILKETDYKIDYLTTVDKGFVTQCLKKQYRQTSNSLTAGEAQLSTFTRGNKFYELTDSRGNVMAVVTDKKMQHSSNGNTVDYYEPDIVSATDYAPFGSPLPSRNYQSGEYRYGFNGKENDNEVKGQGNQIDYGMRIYDPRLGRFLSVDPLSPKYPMLTPYQFASNTPIWAIDLDGLEAAILSSEIQTNALLTEFYNDHLLTSGGKEFSQALKSQTKFDVLYTTYPAEFKDMVIFQSDGNIYRGASAETFFLAISDIKTLHFYRDKKKVAMLQNVKDEDVKKTFDDKKKIIIIAIDDKYGSKETEDKIAKKPKAKRNININGSHALNHEETAHALNKLKGIDKTSIEEHKEYQGDNPDGNNMNSPDINELKPETPAGKNVKELRKIVDDKNKTTKKNGKG